MGTDKNYYEILNLPRDATPDEIRRSYRHIVRDIHPDKQQNSAEATELFIKVQEAYEVLSDPIKRKTFDDTLPQEKFNFKINTIYSRSALINIQEPQLVFALLEMSPPNDVDAIPAPPLNVVLLIDRSTSMKGSRMDIVKTTAIEIIRQIRSEDILSIISFGDFAEVILAAGARRNEREIEHTIQMIQASGGTEIFKGLDAGFREVKRNLSSRFINHIILLTDGKTYGDEENCISLATEASKLGVGISGLGIGDEWNDSFLDKLAAITGGDTTYIEKATDIRQILEGKLQRLAKIYADNLTFTFTKDEGVHINYAFRVQPEPAPIPEENNEIKLGNIPTFQPLRILFEIMISAVPNDLQEVTLAEGRISMYIPVIQEPKISRKIVLARPVQTETLQEQTPPEIISALSQVTLYRMHEKAKQDIQQGNLNDAVNRLQNLATHLLAQGEKDLANTVLVEAHNVQKTRVLSADGDKRIKYGTRSLLISSGTKGIVE